MRHTERNYQGKAQAKLDRRMNKHIEKNRLRHQDEIIRINQERMRKIEREHVRNDHVAPRIEPAKQKKYYILAAVCIALMLLSMFAILQRKAQTETVLDSES